MKKNHLIWRYVPFDPELRFYNLASDASFCGPDFTVPVSFLVNGKFILNCFVVYLDTYIFKAK